MSKLTTIPNTLLVGCTGYIGANLLNYYKANSVKVCGTSRRAGLHQYLDLKKPSLDFLEASSHKFSHAVICAAIPNIAQCQKHPKETFSQNVLGTLELVKRLVDLKIKPILFSTDIVFDGAQDEYFERSTLSPVNEYGFQKKFLEEAVPKLCGEDYLILRLTKNYSIFEQDRTILHEIATKLLKGEELCAARDLNFNPVYVSDVIKALSMLQKVNASGLYNVCGLESTNWFELGHKIAGSMGILKPKITPTTIHNLSDGIPRAKSINLIPKKLLSLFPEFKFRSLDTAIKQVATMYTKQLSL